MQVGAVDGGQAPQVLRTARDARQLRFDDLGTALIATTFVVLDLETTGLSPASDRITEIGAVKVCGGEVLGELRTFVHPGQPIPVAITALTGITDAMVRDAPTIAAVLPAVLGFLRGAVFVAHNAAFDLAFLRAAATAHGYADLQPTVVDTARLARRLLRDEIRDVRLRTVARHLRARTRPEHRALADARATVDVLHGLIERAGAYGATTLEDLRDLARSTSDQAFRRIGLVRDAPTTAGVYRFLDARGEVLYVGKATDLRSRLRNYFGADRRRRIADLVRETDRVEWTTTPTLLEAEVREVRAIHHHRPRYNRRSRRPDAAVHVALTREPFPRLSIVRRPGPAHLRTVGPLPSRRIAEQLIDAIHTAVPLRPCTGRLRRAQDHSACVLKDLGRCGAPCDGTQSHAEYAHLVVATLALLDDPSCLLQSLRRTMLDLARAGRFERAGDARARLHGAARALASVRELESLAAVSRLVAARTVGDGTEVVVLEHGRLCRSACLPGHPDDHTILAVLGGGCEAGLWAVEQGQSADHERSPDAKELPPSRGGSEAGRTKQAGQWGVEQKELPPSTGGSEAGRTKQAGQWGVEQTEHNEELGLVLGWLGRPGTRVVEAVGCYAVAVPGGRALAETVEESRQLGRQLRRDRQLLAGSKVRRRTVVGAEALT